MIRNLKDQAFVPGKNYIEAAGLSTDQKPTAGIITGSRFLEVDTGDIYEFDEVSGTWSKVEDFDGDITAAVDAWLDAHPEATTTVQDGAITRAKLDADLKEKTDAVPGLKSAFDLDQKAVFNVPVIYSDLIDTTKWTVGSGINRNSGVNITSSKLCRSSYIDIKGITLLYIDSDVYDFVLWEYSSGSATSGVVCPRKYYASEPVIITKENGAKKFRVAIMRKDGEDASSSDVTSVVAAMKTFLLTDESLTIQSAPAEAKATGDKITLINSTIDALGETASVASTDLIATNYGINSLNKWVSYLSSDASAGFYNLSGAESVIITPQTGVSTIWAFLDTLNTALGDTPDFSTGYSERISSDAATEYAVSGDMHYLYVLITNSSGDSVYPSVSIRYPIKTDKTLTQSKVPADAKAVGDLVKTRANVKIAMLGDSITHGKIGGSSSAVPDLTIPQAVAKYLGVETTNFGVNGMGWFSKANYDVNAYEYIQTLDLSSYTHITLAYGTNDSAAALGTENDTTEDTILGSAYRVCSYIQSQWPTVAVIIILPILGKSGGSFPEWGWGVERGPSGGEWYFKDFYDAFDAFGLKYHIPIIHGDRAINAWNIEDLIGDNVHPTNTGYFVVGHYMAGQIGSLL